MRQTTPFFDSFGPLLFGKPPVSALAQAFAKISECRSLGQLRKLFGSYIPRTLLDRRPSGANSRKRVFSLEVVFWSFLDQVCRPSGFLPGGRSQSHGLYTPKVSREKDASLSPDTSAYCQARAKIPLDVMDDIHTHLVERLQNHISLKELWHGRRVRVVDGTGISMPDTAENQARWPQSQNQQPGCGFPSSSSSVFSACSPELCLKRLTATTALTKAASSRISGVLWPRMISSWPTEGSAPSAPSPACWLAVWIP